MTIELESLSKRFTNQWIFRNLSYTFLSGSVYGIKGPNGSGKSTLIKIISGYLSPSKGQVYYANDHGKISRDNIFRHLTIAAPYVSMIDDLTVDEMIGFSLRFKGFRHKLNKSQFLEEIELQLTKNTRISQLSSGQNQRLALGLAILSESALVLLDEPGAYLDEQARIWFHDILKANLADRLVIISSNDAKDFRLTHHTISVTDFQ